MSMVELPSGGLRTVEHSTTSLKTALGAFSPHNMSRASDTPDAPFCHKGVRASQVIWGLILGVGLVFSLTAAVQCAKRSYVVYDDNGTQIEETAAPAFLTYFTTSWLILIYPLYLLFKICTTENKEEFIQNIWCHLVILTSEKPKWLNVLVRCSLFCILWNIFLYCFLRSLRLASPLDVVSIFSFISCLIYLLCWIVIQKKFIALRVVAFIMAASGIIINIHLDQNIMWFKVLTTTATVAFSAFAVLLKRMIYMPTGGQIAIFFSAIGLFNSLILWVIFLFTSVVTDAERINWSNAPWAYFVGTAAGITVFCITLELANRLTCRVCRGLSILATIPVCAAVDGLWLNQLDTFVPMRTASLVLIVVAELFTVIPGGWSRGITSLMKRHHQKQHTQVRSTHRSLGNQGALPSQPPIYRSRQMSTSTINGFSMH